MKPPKRSFKRKERLASIPPDSHKETVQAGLHSSLLPSTIPRRLSQSLRNRKRAKVQASKRPTALLRTKELFDQLQNNPFKPTNPAEKWLYDLGIPCYPRRVLKPTKSKAAAEKLPSTENKDPDPVNTAPFLCKTQKVSHRHYTPSVFTRELLQIYGGWEFDKLNPISDGKDEGEVYCRDYRWSEKNYISEMEIRPVAKASCSLDHYISVHLRREVFRLTPGSSGLRLQLPNEWAKEAEYDVPPLYVAPERYEQVLLSRECSDSELDANENVSGNETERSRRSEGRLDIATIPPKIKQKERKKPSNSFIILTEDNCEKIRELCVQFSLDNVDKDEKKKRAAEMCKEMVRLNFPHKIHLEKIEFLRFINVRPPLQPYVEYLPRKDILQNDLLYRTGDATLNEGCLDSETPLKLLHRFLSFNGSSKPVSSESVVEKDAGRLFRGLFESEDILGHDNQRLPFPSHMTILGSIPSPDKYVRVPSRYLKWNRTLLPILFAIENKTFITQSENTGAQLAAAFHSTLIILVLYYLDTRRELNSALHPWLFLYGLECTKFGVCIRAHYPSYEFNKTEPAQSAWKFKSYLVTEKYQDVFNPTTLKSIQLQLLAALLKIRSHSLYVLEQLKAWEKRGLKFYGLS
ncbi:hypothetical protein CPB86DRAFT_878409 [Serendipita vermifera]|nr:hypothetical protein CPB86DRAFT_878409 [Serendipita vermifera]